MFGGIAFLVNGTMCVGVDKDDLIVRCEKDETEKLLAKKGVRECDLSGGRPMKGWLLVGPASAGTTAGFKAWIRFALARGGGAERLQARRAATIDQGGARGARVSRRSRSASASRIEMAQRDCLSIPEDSHCQGALVPHFAPVAPWPHDSTMF